MTSYCGRLATLTHWIPPVTEIQKSIVLNVAAGKHPNHFFHFSLSSPWWGEDSNLPLSLVYASLASQGLGHLKPGNNFFVLYMDHGDVRWCNGGEGGDHLIFQTQLKICGDSFSRLCFEGLPLKYSPIWVRMWHLFVSILCRELVVPVLKLSFRCSLRGIFQGLSLSFSYFFPKHRAKKGKVGHRGVEKWN